MVICTVDYALLIYPVLSANPDVGTQLASGFARNTLYSISL